MGMILSPLKSVQNSVGINRFSIKLTPAFHFWVIDLELHLTPHSNTKNFGERVWLWILQGVN